MADLVEVGHLLSCCRRFPIVCHEMKGVETTRNRCTWPV
jgi:hypothetical protein